MCGRLGMSYIRQGCDIHLLSYMVDTRILHHIRVDPVIDMYGNSGEYKPGSGIKRIKGPLIPCSKRIVNYASVKACHSFYIRHGVAVDILRTAKSTCSYSCKDTDKCKKLIELRRQRRRGLHMNKLIIYPGDKVCYILGSKHQIHNR